MQSPQVLQLIMDSLRYWVLEMHVDGFRFDLASALARELYEVDRLGAFFDIIHQDPVLSQVKLIAEPWDLGAGGYQVGQLPGALDRVERQVPRRGAPLLARRRRRRLRAGHAGSPAAAISTSTSGRRPYASINFITAHDGFTLHDLVSYNEKHNEANGEGNRDGENHNLSWNCGVEGPTDDPAVNALRERQKRNLLATLLLSQGVPMLSGGDEIEPHAAGQQQRLLPGQRDLVDVWDLTPAQRELLDFTRQAHSHPPRSPGAPAPPVLPRARRARRRRQGHRLARPGRQRDDRRELERRRSSVPRRAARRQRHRRSGRARRAHRRRHAAAAAQRAPRRNRCSRCPSKTPTSAGNG